MTLAWLSLLTLMPFTLMMHWPGCSPATAATVPGGETDTNKERLEDTTAEVTVGGEGQIYQNIHNILDTKLSRTFSLYFFFIFVSANLVSSSTS